MPTGLLFCWHPFICFHQPSPGHSVKSPWWSWVTRIHANLSPTRPATMVQCQSPCPLQWCNPEVETGCHGQWTVQQLPSWVRYISWVLTLSCLHSKTWLWLHLFATPPLNAQYISHKLWPTWFQQSYQYQATTSITSQQKWELCQLCSVPANHTGPNRINWLWPSLQLWCWWLWWCQGTEVSNMHYFFGFPDWHMCTQKESMKVHPKARTFHPWL